MNFIKNIGLLFFLLSMVLTSCDNTVSITHKEKEVIAVEMDTTWMKLSLREKIGQIVCYKYNRAQMMDLGSNSAEIFMGKYPVGSVFLANWEMAKLASRDSLKIVYSNAGKELADVSKYPLLISEDFETGLGSLIPQYTELTREMGLGATASVEKATWFGDIIASEARSIGINWLLHPVADLNKNPFNFLTNVRATGDRKELAIKILPAQVKAMQNRQVAATAKHFPGDGTDVINQHFATSTMKLSVKDWKEQHGAVFQKLIDEGVMVIMPGHITFPAYQKEKLNGEYLPATLSSELMVKLLKNEMNFEGVIVSDALNMAGCSGYYKNQFETEIESFKAGADILLWPQLSVIDTLEARIERGEIPISRLNDAVSRVWNLKMKLGLFDDNYEDSKPISAEKLTDNKNKAYEISKASITEVSNKNKVFPFSKTEVKNILIVVVSDNEDLNVFNPMKEALIEEGFNINIQNDLSFFANESKMKLIAEKYDRIIFSFYSIPGAPWGTLSLSGDKALTMWSANYLPFDKVITVGFGDPYKNLLYMPRVWARINCYNTDSNTQKALVKGLVGEFKFTGKSPVTIN